MRREMPFHQEWTFSRDGERWEYVTLPHTWNAVDGQDGGNDYLRAVCRYRKRFAMPQMAADEEVWIEFAAVAMSAQVTLNGKLVCCHQGGYSAFRAELTPFLREVNVLEVAVDNGANDRVYPQKADFTFYGGMTREVTLLVVPRRHFALNDFGGKGIRVTPMLDETRTRAEVHVEVWTSGHPKYVSLETDGQHITLPIVDNHAEGCFHLVKAHLWDGVDDPYQYTLTAALEGGDAVSVRYGLRTMEADPQRGFLLNGRSYPLRGVARHQDCAGCGPCMTQEQMERDMDIMLEMGVNTVRLAHYQHPQAFYDLCDDAGLIVWAEIPWITQDMPSAQENVVSQMTELIVQNAQHASIFCWGLSNEISATGQITEDLIARHRALNDLCHRLDPTRPTAMAHVFMLDSASPLAQVADVNSYNLYYGWYLGELEQNEQFLDGFHRQYPHRAIGLSEYGADANVAFQTSSPERGDYSEQYQCLYHEHMLRLIQARPWLWATHVWHMFDFAADGRDEGGAHGLNQKGLVTFDRKVKKDAFYLYKAYWSREPFVHLCQRRYVDRAEDETTLTVYSNQPRVTLEMDGREIASKDGAHVFTFRTAITGEHIITARCGDLRDTIRIKRVEQPNPAYVLGAREVINWFEKREENPACYSVRDTLRDVAASPARERLFAMIDRARAKRGAVAQREGANEQMLQAMGHMRVESLLRTIRDTVSTEEAMAFNAYLQTLPKPAKK